MNSIHDMGGMHGLGPIVYERSEPVFHARWEARVAALFSAMGAWGRWTADALRFRIESMPADEYLRASYYERWLAALTEISIESGLISTTELETGKPDQRIAKQTPALTLDQARTSLTRNREWSRPEPAPARFRRGDTVRARNIHPKAHTRLPRYVRGHSGRVECLHGCHVFPDSVVLGKGEDPQWLYTVCFEGRELWGDTAEPGLVVSIDAFEPYLEPV